MDGLAVGVSGVKKSGVLGVAQRRQLFRFRGNQCSAFWATVGRGAKIVTAGNAEAESPSHIDAVTAMADQSKEREGQEQGCGKPVGYAYRIAILHERPSTAVSRHVIIATNEQARSRHTQLVLEDDRPEVMGPIPMHMAVAQKHRAISDGPKPRKLAMIIPWRFEMN